MNRSSGSKKDRKIAIFTIFLLQEFIKNRTEEYPLDRAIESILVASVREVSVRAELEVSIRARLQWVEEYIEADPGLRFR